MAQLVALGSAAEGGSARGRGHGVGVLALALVSVRLTMAVVILLVGQARVMAVARGRQPLRASSVMRMGMRMAMVIGMEQAQRASRGGGARCWADGEEFLTLIPSLV